METKEKISQLLGEHAEWQKQLANFKKEMQQLNNDLGSFLLKKEPRAIPSNAEHLQNQFILQDEVLDILKHDMKQYENLLESNDQEPGKNTAVEILEIRTSLQSRLGDFIRYFDELKEECGTFLNSTEVAL